MGTHFQFLKGLLLHSVCLLPLFSQLEMPFLSPPSPLTLLLPGKLLLILQGPANCLLLQEALPDSTGSVQSSSLITRCLSVPGRVEDSLSLNFHDISFY